jgi:beta-lactam-binding protein with PASTA domain
MKRRVLVKQLTDAEYREVRNNNHAIFVKKGARPIQVPNHREFNEITAMEILKAAGLKK